VKLPGLRKLRDLKQNAGRRLRAALVPELRELPGLVRARRARTWRGWGSASTMRARPLATASRTPKRASAS